LVSAGIYGVLLKNKKDVSKTLKPESNTVYVPVRLVNNELKIIELESYGQVTPNSEINVSFEVQGKLERGNTIMKPGSKFRRGQILYRVDNSEAFYALSARKAALATIVLNCIPDIELDFPSERNKWVSFINDLKVTKQLPELPSIASSKESMFIMSRNIISEYYTLKSQEARLEKYFYVAPFNGTVISIGAEPGAIASPGMMIARIAKTGDYEVKVPVSMEDLDIYKNKKTANFINTKGQRIATGSITRISDVINQQTQSANVYYSIKPFNGERIYNGMYLNVSIEKEAPKNAITIPRAAMQNNSVMILSDSILHRKNITIVGFKSDSVYITGLTDGQKVVLEQIESSGKNVHYIGINR